MVKIIDRSLLAIASLLSRSAKVVNLNRNKEALKQALLDLGLRSNQINTQSHSISSGWEEVDSAVEDWRQSALARLNHAPPQQCHSKHTLANGARLV